MHHLFRELPPDTQMNMAKSAGKPIVAHSAIEAAIPMVLRHVPKEIILQSWVKAHLDHFLSDPSARFAEWQGALLGLIMSSVKESIPPTEGMVRSAEDVVSGKAEAMPPDTQKQWEEWAAVFVGRLVIREIRALDGTLMERLRAEIEPILAECPDDHETWYPKSFVLLESIPTTLDNLVSNYGKLINRSRVALEFLGCIVPPLEDSNPVLFKDDIRKCLQESWYRHLLESLGRFEERIKVKDDLYKSRILVDLSNALCDDVPLRDKAMLAEEAERLEAHLLQDPTSAPEGTAPVLALLYRILVGNEEMTEVDRELLEENMSGRFCKLLQQGKLLVAVEEKNAAQVTIELIDDRPSCLELGAFEGIVEVENLADSGTEAKAISCYIEEIGPESGEPELRQTEIHQDEVPEAAPECLTLEGRNAPPPAMPEKSEDMPTDSFLESEEQSPWEVGGTGESASLASEETREQGAQTEAFQQGWTELMARLLRERRFDLAYWLAFALGQESPLPLWFSEIALLGLQLQPRFYQSEQRLGQLFEEAALKLEDLEDAHALILGASLIRPALLAPHTYPSFLLKEVGHHLRNITGFEKLTEELANFAERGVPLADEFLKELSRYSSWEVEMRKLTDEIQDWREAAPTWSIKFPKAEVVWGDWVHPNGALRRLVDAAVHGLDDQAVRQAVGSWRSQEGLEDQITSSLKRRRQGPRKTVIKYGARSTLQRYVGEALDMVERLLALRMRKPIDHERSVANSRQTLGILKPNAEDTMSTLRDRRQQEGSPLFEIGIELLVQALQEIISEFRTQAPGKHKDPLTTRDYALLYLDEFDLSGGRLQPSVQLARAIEELASAPVSEQVAFEKQLKRGHLLCAKAIMDNLLPESASRQNMEERLETERRHFERVVSHDLNMLRDEIEGQFLRGALSEKGHSNLISDVDGLESLYDLRRLEPRLILDRIPELREKLAAEASLCINEMESQLHSLPIDKDQSSQSLSPRFQEEITQHLAKQECSVVEEILSRARKALEDGQVDEDAILSIDRPRRLFEQFTECLPRLLEQCGNINSLRSLKGGALAFLSDILDTDSGLDHNLSIFQNMWARLSSSAGFQSKIPGEFYRLLRWLGFQVQDKDVPQLITTEGSPNFLRHFRFGGNIDSPLPLFGSMAHNSHDFVLIWNQLEPSKFAQWLKTSRISKDRPVTFLYFNCLSPEARRQAVRATRQHGYSPLVVDSCLGAWLCAFPAIERVRALFSAGMPGAPLNPYAPDMAGAIHPEMFFGRKTDIEQLWDLNGTCLVYGGRQLGKSALLRQVHRTFHSPEQDHFVFYEGMKYAGNLWDEIRQTLTTHNLLPTKGLTRPDKIKAAVKEMMDANPSRRILLLFDECDHFLEEDSKRRFEHVALARDLMTETSRRFKIVLTGLHNVQRFQRIPNQPLAHLGMPLCVGPLEPQSAASLIRRPLEILGYKFEPETLVQRVLAYTNYHPSLIQLFCHELVNVMLTSAKTGGNPPPYLINEELITQVYRKAQLRDKMRQRFDWTLDLDTRYRALGYTVAFLHLNDDSGEISGKGLHPDKILRDVRDFWPQGFNEVGLDELQGLLDEMVGLGLLESTGGRSYRLRSQNVLRLLGSQEEVMAQLESFGTEPWIPTADPQVMHRVLKDGGRGETSPLTMNQEARLFVAEHGLSLVIGSRAMLIDRVPKALTDLSMVRTEAPPLLISGPDSTLSHLKGLREISRRENRIILTGQGISSGAFAALIQESLEWLKKLSSEQSFTRIIGLVEPDNLLYFARSGLIEAVEQNPLSEVVRLSRWKEPGLRHWFDDVGTPPDNALEQPKAWMLATGGWPHLLTDIQDAFLRNRSQLNDLESFVGQRLQASLNQIGLEADSELGKILAELAQMGGPVELVDASVLLAAEQMPPERFKLLIDVLEDLGLVYLSSEGVAADPIMGKVCKELLCV